MLIGIISDTHENMHAIDKSVKIFNTYNVSLVLHAGDIISPITYSHFSKLNCKMKLVFGNNDGEKTFLKEKFSNIGEIKQPPFEFQLEEEQHKVNFLLLHEPYHLEEFIKSQKYDFIIYGHTHRQDLKIQGKTLILNPGEAGGWLTGEKYIALLDTKTKKVERIKL